MDEHKEIHQEPQETDELPPGLVQYLDGSKLSDRIGEAICVSTADEDGWPHAAILSVGEILAVDARHLKIALRPHSTTTKNIERTGRVSLAMVHDGALWEVHLKAKRALKNPIGGQLAFFTAKIKNTRMHRVDYADVISSVTYRLHDPKSVVKRWEKQVEELRACGSHS